MIPKHKLEGFAEWAVLASVFPDEMPAPGPGFWPAVTLLQARAFGGLAADATWEAEDRPAAEHPSVRAQYQARAEALRAWAEQLRTWALTSAR